MTDQISIKRKKLILFSVRPGAQTGELAGKNSKHNLNPELFLTKETVAEAVFGSSFFASGDKITRASRRLQGDMTTKALQGIAEARLDQGMTTFIVDPNCVSDIERTEYAEIAKEVGADFEVVLMDSTPQKARNYATHYDMLLSDVMDKYHRYEATSQYPHSNYTENTRFSYDIPRLPDNKIDVIGDVHGLYKELTQMIGDLGYKIEDNTASHPEGRKLLFMGDLMDRGPDSVSVIELACNTVKSGNGFAIKGNHEQMFLNGVHNMNKHGRLQPSSLTSGDTLAQLLRIEESKRNEYIKFIEDMPTYMIYQDEENNKIVFSHGDIETFDPLLTPDEHLKNGDGGHKTKDSDKGYQELLDKGVNKYALVRGHKKSTSNQPGVVSLDDAQVFNGTLLSMPLDRVVMLMNVKGMSLNDAFQNTKNNVKCNYYYGNQQKDNNELYAGLENLHNQGLVEKDADVKRGLIRYVATQEMYSKNSYFMTIPWLKKATGIVIEPGGQIAIHPSDRMGEAGDNTPYPEPEDKVAAIEFLRGFEANVSMNPYGKGLLITTSSSFESRYTHMAEESIKKNGLYERLNKYLSNKKCTLTLKIMHPEDTRSKVKEGSQANYGVKIISGRPNTPKGNNFSEQHLDNIGKNLKIGRPNWIITNFREVVQNVITPHYSNTEPKNNFFVNNPNISMRKINGENDNEMESLNFRLYSPQAMEKRFYDFFSPSNVKTTRETNGQNLEGQHFIMRKAAALLFSNHSNEDLIRISDINGIRSKKEIPYDERKKKMEETKEEKLKLVKRYVGKAYKTALEERMDPEIRRINEKVKSKQMENEEKKKRMQEMKIKKSKENKKSSPTP